MSLESDEARLVLRNLWSAQGDPAAELDEECNPNKVCRNMKDVTFEGFAGDGKDIKTAWKEALERDGKLGTGSIGDLVNEKTFK
jgi:hypothetical protein